MAESESSEEHPGTSPSKKDQPEEVFLIVRRYYDSLCKLIEAADPQSVSNKLYAKGIVGSAAHRALETLGVSKGQKSASVVDAFMLNLEGMAVREKQLSTLEIFLEVLATINSPCRQIATEIGTAAGCPPPVTSPSLPLSPIKSTPADKFACNYQNVVSKLKDLKFPETHWRPLGTALKLRADWLDSIAADRKADNPVNQTNALLGMLTKWLQKDIESSWSKLAKAVGELGHSELSEELNSMKEVELDVSSIHEKLAEGDFEAADWKQLATCLGMKAGSIRTLSATYEGNLAHSHALALVDVLDRWMRFERKPSWSHLADAMDKIGFPKVAQKLRDQCQHEENQH